MIEMGLKASFDDALAQRAVFFQQAPRLDIQERLVGHFGVQEGSDADAVEEAGRLAFYQRNVESHITLFEGCYDLLALAKTRFQLFLVTSGSPSTQRQKVDLLGIEPFFTDMTFVNSGNGETKKDAFLQLTERHQLNAPRVLVVGDRIDREISAANQLGMWTCQIARGEYRHLKVTSASESADIVCAHVTELIGWLGLNKSKGTAAHRLRQDDKSSTLGGLR